MEEEKRGVFEVIKQKTNVLIMRSRTVAILIYVLFLWACGSDGGLYITGGDNSTPVEVKLVHNTLLVVRAVVNGSMNLDMLVDTGSSRTHVPAGIFGNPDGEVYISSLCLENGICFYNFIAWSSDSAFTQNKDGYFNGIIGVDLLENFDVTFDFKSERIYFYDTLESGSSGLLTIPFHYESSRPYTNILIEGLSRGTNLLDTGAAYTRITYSMLASLDQEPEVLFESVVFNFDGFENVEYVPLTDYCVDMACPGDIIVQISSWPAVGGTFFREYLTIFRFSENVVKLDRYYDRSHIKESGIQRMGLQINIYDASEIIYVREDGFAWEGGLREGDEIISVNGFPIDSLGYFGIYEFLEDTSVKEYQFLIRTPQGDVEDVTVPAE